MVELRVDGMDCNNCAASIQRYLERKGLRDVMVNFQTREVRYRANDAVLDAAGVRAGIDKLGFTVVEELGGADAGGEGSEGRELDHGHTHDHATVAKRRLLICTAFTLPLLLGHLLMMIGVRIPPLENGWVQFTLALPVYLIGGLHFGRSAWNGLYRARTLNMDVLIFLGATAAFVYSLVGLAWQDPRYYFFETAATIITLVLVGNWLEARAVERTTTAISALSNLQLPTARRVMPSGTLVELPVEEIEVGDRIRVATGEKVPLDATVVDGGLTVDESLLTGESAPQDRLPGQAVLGGSLVRSGQATLEVTAGYRDGTLASIIELVKTAQADRPKLQRLADRISAIFVPVVIVISVLTFVICWSTGYASATDALMNAIAVLLISCPCAMGLATPTAVMVGVGRLARMGVLIRGGSTIERFARIKQVVFDKTGTLTTGELSVNNFYVFPEHNAAKVRRIIYDLEARSNHPIASSVRSYLEAEPLPPQSTSFIRIDEQPGRGLTATDTFGNTYYLGAVRADLRTSGRAQRVPNNAAAVLLVNDEPVAHFDLADELRPGALEAVHELSRAGLSVALLTGDNEYKAQAVATRTGIGQVFAEQLPDQKLDKIAELSAERPTAMVGDGINDAAALSRADLGISLGGASDVALDAARVVLLRPDLRLLARGQRVAALTLRTIKESLFWAFSYNVVAIPLAALGFLSPMWAALFMAFSDVVVIGNAIRLKRRKIQ